MDNRIIGCKNFVNLIMEKLQKYFGTDYIFSFSQRMKNNCNLLREITIMKEGQSIIQVIILNPHYEKFCSGIDINEIFQDILREYKDNIALERVLSFINIMEFSEVKDRIIMKLLNYNESKKVLIDALHIKYFDMVVVFYIVIKNDNIFHPIIPIKVHYLSYWKVSKDEIYYYARINSQNLLPSKIEPIHEVRMKIRREEAENQASNENDYIVSNDYQQIKRSTSSVYILTNISQINGATSILYDGILKEFAGQMKQDLIIIPSSIHEVLLLPAECDIKLNKIKAMVSEVNSQISGEDVLSDTIYYYNREIDNLSIYD